MAYNIFKDGGIATVALANDAVDASKLANNAVDSAAIAGDAVTAAKIGAGEVAASELASNAVETAKINDGAVTAGKLGANAVETAKIADDAVSSGKIAAGAVIASKLGAGAVETAKINDAAVIADKIAADAVTTAKINNGAVVEDKIAGDAVTSGKIAADAVIAAKIASNAVETAKINNNAVTTAKIAGTAVTTDKLADDAVSSGKIAAGAVIASKLGANAVETSKIADDAVTYAKLQNLATGNRVLGASSSGVIGEVQVSNDMLAGSIANAKLANSTISGVALGANLAALSVDDSSIEFSAGSAFDGSAASAIRVKASGVTNDMLAGSIANAKLANDGITIAGAPTSLGGSITAATIIGGNFGGDFLLGNQSDDTCTVSGHLKVDGNLTVEGATVTLNSATLEVEDKNIELGKMVNPANLTVTATSGQATFTLPGSHSGKIIVGTKLTRAGGLANWADGVTVVYVKGIVGTTITVTSDPSLTAAGTAAGSNGSIEFTVDNTTDAAIDGGGIIIKGDSDKEFKYSAASEAFQSNQHMVPDVNNSKSLGGSTLRWKMFASQMNYKVADCDLNAGAKTWDTNLGADCMVARITQGHVSQALTLPPANNDTIGRMIMVINDSNADFVLATNGSEVINNSSSNRTYGAEAALTLLQVANGRWCIV